MILFLPGFGSFLGSAGIGIGGVLPIALPRSTASARSNVSMPRLARTFGANDHEAAGANASSARNVSVLASIARAPSFAQIRNCKKEIGDVGRH